MNRAFRSRGIRIVYANNKISCQEKIYYEPDDSCLIENEYINRLQKQGLISLFEYSVICGVIDTYNFHVSLLNDDYKNIYSHLLPEIKDNFIKIQNCFGDCMKNYTVGYKLNNSQIQQESYYFYPTILKKQYRIKGITDVEKIHSGMKQFCEVVFEKNSDCWNEINDFAKIIYKFKGISIHISEREIGYKIYGRIETSTIQQYLFEKCGYSIEGVSQYGECVLVALRINNGTCQGYNIYYLR